MSGFGVVVLYRTDPELEVFLSRGTGKSTQMARGLSPKVWSLQPQASLFWADQQQVLTCRSRTQNSFPVLKIHPVHKENHKGDPSWGTGLGGRGRQEGIPEECLPPGLCVCPSESLPKAWP